MTSVRDLDRLVAKWHLLKHPFYQAWTHGELSASSLTSYARQYYHFESQFPRYVAGAYARLERTEDRRQLLENLVDEEGRERTHPELWLDFARAVGVGRTSPGRWPVGPATARLLATYERDALNGSAASALGSIFAYESQFPAVAAEKARGLRAHYGVNDPAALEFFDLHTVADVAHAQAERELLARVLARDPAAGREALGATERSLKAWWNFLSAYPEGKGSRGPAAA